MGEVKTTFGRQVVFVNPSYLVKTIVIQRLLEMEYEVYYVDSPRHTKNVLRKFPHSICLIDVDTAMASEEFLNMIASIEKDPEFQEVSIGILTRRAQSLQKRYCDVLKLPAGFINTAANKEALIEELTQLFTTNDVKGRRQFVRVSLTNESSARFYCKIQGIPVHFPLRDISSCGFACEAPGFPEAAFTVNSLIQGELQLGSTILPCSVVLFAIKTTDKSLMLVMLFAQTNAWSNKKTIRSFVAETLQKMIERIKENNQIDDADYSKVDENLKPKTDSDEQQSQPDEESAPETVQYAGDEPQPEQNQS